MIESVKKHPYRAIGILIILTLVIFACYIFLVSYSEFLNADKVLITEKGELVPGGSSGLQALSSDREERHIYTYEGIAGETIRIYATSPSNTLLWILVFAPGQERPWLNYRGDLEGQRGDDAEIIDVLPVDGIYTIQVDTADVGGQYTIQVDVIE